MRALLAVGCDDYYFSPLSKLRGAANDATAIFKHLVTDGWGEYDPDISRLLISPTLNDLQTSLTDILFEYGSIDEFTIFFAGHGGTKDDSYFLCVKDTQTSRMSVTALGLSQLFAWLNEAKVRQTNVVIDACESGGVARDISSLLNPNTIGKSGSPAISVLAAAAADEYAAEIGGRGVCTDAILKCLVGDVVVQTTRPSLDLVEIGRTVSEMLSGKHQTPVAWGLNLYGPAQFAKNPRFAGGTPHLTEVLGSFGSDTDAKRYIETKSDEIWTFYLALARDFDAAKFLGLLGPICSTFEPKPETLATFVKGISSTFGARLRENADPFEEPLLYATCVTALLPHSDDKATAELAAELIVRFCEAISRACVLLLDELKESEFALLSPLSAHSDFYFLPLRIVNVLGWIAAGLHASKWIGRPEFFNRPVAQELFRFITEKYSGSIVAVSDEQTSAFISLLTASAALETSDEVEQITCLLFSTLCELKGNISREGLSGEEAYRYLAAKMKGDFTDVDDLIARPTSLLPALLLAYDFLSISDVADRCMRALDHANLNIYIPSTHKNYAETHMEGGQNYSYQIGYNIFCVADMSTEYNNIIEKISEDAALNNPVAKCGALFASLIAPDRQPWFLFSYSPST